MDRVLSAALGRAAAIQEEEYVLQSVLSATRFLLVVA